MVHSSTFRPAVFACESMSCEPPSLFCTSTHSVLLLTRLTTQAKLNWQQQWWFHQLAWTLWSPYTTTRQCSMFITCFCTPGVVGHLDRGNMSVSQWEWSILTRCFGDTWQPSWSLNYMYKHMANSGNCVLRNSNQVGDTEGGKEREVKEGVVCVIPLTAAYLSIHGCSVPIDSCPRMPCPV